MTDIGVLRRDLAEFSQRPFKRYLVSDALLMKEHGIQTMATSISQANYIEDQVEGTAKIAFVAANIPAEA